MRVISWAVLGMGVLSGLLVLLTIHTLVWPMSVLEFWELRSVCPAIRTRVFFVCPTMVYWNSAPSRAPLVGRLYYPCSDDPKDVFSSTAWVNRGSPTRAILAQMEGAEFLFAQEQDHSELDPHASGWVDVFRKDGGLVIYVTNTPSRTTLCR